MFERFTRGARAAVVTAADQARALGHSHVGTEHLLLGVVGDTGSPTQRALGRLGLDQPRVQDAVRRLRPEAGADLDPDALRSIGIDLSAVRARVEETFGPGALDRGRPGTGHVPFSPRSKKVLELALREARRRRDGSIGGEHLVLGMLRDGGGLAAVILSEAGIDRAGLERELAAPDPGRADAG